MPDISGYIQERVNWWMWLQTYLLRMTEEQFQGQQLKLVDAGLQFNTRFETFHSSLACSLKRPWAVACQ